MRPQPSRKRPLAAGLLLLTALLGSGCTLDPIETVLPPTEARSIIIVTIDTLRADHLAPYGYFRQTSPIIDALAREGVIFENTITPIATTLPAHTSLWTSLHPMETGVVTNGKRFNRPANGSIRFFAEMLREIGYNTAAFVAATPVKSSTGISAGFDSFNEPPSGIRARSADRTTDRVLEWMDSAPESPFFLWVHYFDPHQPLTPPQDLRRAFKSDRKLTRHLESLRFPDPDNPRIHRRHNLYDAEILGVDRQIGRLVDKVKQLGVFDDLTLAIVGDHGEGLGQHGWLGHGRIHNEQLFVPFIVKFPSGLGLAGTRHSGLTSLIDVAPILAATLSLQLPESDIAQFRGKNVFALEDTREFAFAQRTFKEKKGWDEERKFSLLSSDWKFTSSSAGEEELFDMKRDRAETVNVLAENPEIAARFRDQLQTLLAELDAGKWDLQVEDDLSEQTRAELRSLGYL